MVSAIVPLLYNYSYFFLFKAFATNFYKLACVLYYMIDGNSFEVLRKELEKSDGLRESLIKKSRDILKNSKKAIYCLHRKDTVHARELLDNANSIIQELNKLVCNNRSLLLVGAYNEAMEEYAEAMCYERFLLNRTLPFPKELNIPTEVYLSGVCDLTGELLRKAVNSATKGDVSIALEIKDFVTALHDELMLFNFRNSLLRRKFDRIKYCVEKLEDLGLQLTLKAKN
jgi:translin